MKLNVTQKILVGYVIGFILLAAFAALTVFNGKKIEATTVALSQEKIPGLIAVSSLKSHLQSQTNQLYELYATNDQQAFANAYQATVVAMQQDVSKLSALAEYKPYELKLAVLGEKQGELTDTFVSIMRQPDVDWDAAREALSAFTKSANQTEAELDQLVNMVAEQTLARANDSQSLTAQLVTYALILAVLVFLGVLAMAAYSKSQVATPLRAVSTALADITTRRDFTYRLKQHTNDEIGDIVISANHLLEEFQKLARTLDGTVQEVNRTTNSLTEVTEDARLSMVERNTKLRNATQDFMRDIESSTKNNGAMKEIDMDLHRAQMKFIQTHLHEIDEGKQVTDRNVTTLQKTTSKLQKLADNMQSQIRLLNF